MAQAATSTVRTIKRDVPFTWEGKDKRGSRVKGKSLAPDEAALRADLRRLFVGATMGTAPGRASLARLNDLLAARGGRLRVERRNGRLRHAAAPDLVDAVGLPVVVSAIELLTSPDLGRVKMCPAARCAWLFLDDSRNGSRRWCSMETCGNRAKARLHYDRMRRGLLARQEIA